MAEPLTPTAPPSNAAELIPSTPLISPPVRSDNVADAVARDEETFFSKIVDAFTSDNLTVGVLGGRIPQAINRDYLLDGFDPNFTLTKEGLSEAAEKYGITGDASKFNEAMSVANSQNHLDILGKQYSDNVARDERLSRSGMLPMLGYRGMAALIDPLVLVGGIGTAERFGNFVYRGGNATVRGAAARSGLLAGAATAGQESVLSAGDPTRNAQDVALAGLFGLSLGGALGGVIGKYKGVSLTGPSVDIIPPATIVSDSVIQRQLLNVRDVLSPEPVPRGLELDEAVQKARAEMSPTFVSRLETLAKDTLPKGGVTAVTKTLEIARKTLDDLKANRATREQVRAIASAQNVTRKAAERIAAKARTAQLEPVQSRIAELEEQLAKHKTAAQATEARNIHLNTGEVPALFRAEFDARVKELTTPPKQKALAALLRDSIGGRVDDVAAKDWNIDVNLDDALIPFYNKPARPARPAPVEAPAPPDSAGAARATFGVEPLIETTSVLDAAAAHAGDIPQVSRLGRIDSLNVLLRSPSAKVRQLGAALFPEHVDHSFKINQTASELQHILDSRIRREAKIALRVNFVKWAADNGIPKWKVWSGMVNAKFDEFAQDVGMAIRDPSTPPNAHVSAAAAVVRRKFAEALNEGKKVGVFADEIPVASDYLPRVFDEGKLHKLWAGPGQFQVTALVKKSMLAAAAKVGRTLDDNAVDIISKAYVHTIRGSSHGVSRSLMHGIGLDDLDQLRGMMQDMGGVSPVEIEDILARVSRKNDSASTLSQAKHRLDLDETTTMQAADGSTLRITDMLETNVDVLLDKYSRRVSGAIALKQTMGIVGSTAERGRLRNEVLSSLEDVGVTGVDALKVASVAEAFVRRIAGVPLEDTTSVFGQHPLSKMHRFTDGLRKFNFATYMVQSGFASVAEFGAVLSKAGIGGLVDGVFHFRQFMRNAETGQVPDELTNFFEEYLGVGADNLLHPIFNRMDDLTTDTLDPRMLSKGERGLNVAQHLVAEKISALGPMTRFQRRLVMAGVLSKLEKAAFANKPLTTGQLKRLRSAGLDDKDLASLKKSMTKHSITMQSGYRNRSFTRTDLDAWAADDPESFSRVMNAIGRESNRTIIEGNIADAPLWMQSDLGRIASQFRSYAVNAHTKLLLRGISNLDAETTVSFMSSMIFASMAYTVQNSINYAANPEQLKKRLSWDSIAKASFARAGHAALLPGVVDTLVGMTGFDPVFDSRSTGLPSGAVTSIPAINTLDSAMKALESTTSWQSDRQFSRDHFRAITGLVPVVGRMVGVRTALDAISQDLPYESKINY